MARIYDKNKHLKVDTIIIRKSVHPLQKSFFILFELWHLLYDISRLKQLPEDTPTYPLFSLPEYLFTEESEVLAEIFALIALLPSPALAWEFRREHTDGKPLSCLTEAPGFLRPDVEERVISCLSPMYEISKVNELPEDLRDTFRKNLDKRIRSHFTYIRSRETRPFDILPKRFLKQEDVNSLKSTLFESICWCEIDDKACIKDCNLSYTKLLGLEKDKVIGTEIIELADGISKEWFKEAFVERFESDRPIQYFFGFKKNALNIPKLVCHITTWPVDYQGKRTSFVFLRPRGISFEAITEIHNIDRQWKRLISTIDELK